MDSAPKLSVAMILLGSRDPDASAAFYSEMLGFALRNRFEDFAFIEAAGFTLGFSGGLMRARPPKGAEAVEIVFGVEGVTRAYDELRAKGVTFLSEPHVVDGTNYVANFEDPDGHLLSLYGPR